MMKSKKFGKGEEVHKKWILWCKISPAFVNPLYYIHILYILQLLIIVCKFCIVVAVYKYIIIIYGQ